MKMNFKSVSHIIVQLILFYISCVIKILRVSPVPSTKTSPFSTTEKPYMIFNTKNGISYYQNYWTAKDTV